jgi:hypothetical protein
MSAQQNAMAMRWLLAVSTGPGLLTAKADDAGRLVFLGRRFPAGRKGPLQCFVEAACRVSHNGAIGREL